MRQETYEALLTDIAESLAMHGFEHVIFIGDSGGNGSGMTAVAQRLNDKFPGARPMFAHVPEHYMYNAVGTFMREQGLVEGSQSDNLHDDPIISLNMYYADPSSIRWAERVQTGLAKINGVDVSDPVKNAELAAKIVNFRADYTIEGIKRAIANGGTVQQQGGRGGGAGGAGGAGGR
jgi:creatinine amidohydrolase/Fe(II)-dependent formamide hydrolase-like protein